MFFHYRPISFEISSESSPEPECSLNLNAPVYDVPKAQYSAEMVIHMLLDPNKAKICSERPTNITHSSTFVIDLEKLEHLDDAKKDNFGKWVHSGSHTVPFKAWFAEDGEVEFERLEPGSTGPGVQLLHRINSYHPFLQANASLHYWLVKLWLPHKYYHI